MPELPEVEAAKKLLERGCVGKRIEKVVAANDDKVFEGASPDDVRRALEGRRVVAAHRKGKYLWLELDNEESPWPLIHFGMTGGIVVQSMGATKYKRIHLESNPNEWPPRFTKLELDLEGGAKIAFVDARRFGRVKLLANPPAQEPLSKLGFDVLDELPPLEQFIAAVRKRGARAPGLKIKALLLDQEFCSGIGNWVGDEVLYHARIHPEQSAASLDDSSLAALRESIRSVVAQAVEAEADADRFPRDWLFHYRWNSRKPGSVNGHKIEFVTVGSRTSAFVPAFQKLQGAHTCAGSGGSKAKGRAKTKGSGASTKGSRGSAKKVAASDSEEEEEEEVEAASEAKAEAEEVGTPRKRSSKAGAAKGAKPARGSRGKSRTERGKQQKRKHSDSEEDQDQDQDQEEAEEASSEEEDESEGEEEQEEEEEEEEEKPPMAKKKRSRGSKAPPAPAAKKKKRDTAATPKRPAAPRSRKTKT